VRLSNFSGLFVRLQGFIVTYSAKDAAGNEAIPVMREVRIWGGQMHAIPDCDGWILSFLVLGIGSHFAMEIFRG
jgi:hypothetical protein